MKAVCQRALVRLIGSLVPDRWLLDALLYRTQRRLGNRRRPRSDDRALETTLYDAGKLIAKRDGRRDELRSIRTSPFGSRRRFTG